MRLLRVTNTDSNSSFANFWQNMRPVGRVYRKLPEFFNNNTLITGLGHKVITIKPLKKISKLI